MHKAYTPYTKYILYTIYVLKHLPLFILGITVGILSFAILSHGQEIIEQQVELPTVSSTESILLAKTNFQIEALENKTKQVVELRRMLNEILLSSRN